MADSQKPSSEICSARETRRLISQELGPGWRPSKNGVRHADTSSITDALALEIWLARIAANNR